MTTSKIIYLSTISLFLMACGPSTQEKTLNQPSPQDKSSVMSTEDLHASPTFDFKTESTIRLSVNQFPSQSGKLNIYHDYEHYDASLSLYYPDYSSLVASYIATVDQDYIIQKNDNWQHLILEWLPMDGQSHETYRRIILSDAESYIFSF